MPSRSREVVGYKALRWTPSDGADVNDGLSAYDEPADDGVFRADSVRWRMARAGYHTAKLTVDLPNWATHAWRWRELFSIDDRVSIVSAEDLEIDRTGLFSGFVADVNMSVTRSESVVVTAVSNAYRLARDARYRVYGRYMRTKGGSVAHFSGLPCVFNAGGRPNRHPDLQTDLGATYMGSQTGVAVFTGDDAPGAVYWSPADIVEYLAWRYNTDEDWIVNPSPVTGSAFYTADNSLVLEAEGMSLWEAMAAACDQAGFDMWESVQNGDNQCSAQIVIQQIGDGAAATIMHQDVDADGNLTVFDLDQTNATSFDIAESSTNCITRPIVAGGRTLYEITVDLQQAWDSADLAIPAGEEAYVDAESHKTSDYYKRFVTTGGDHARYADVGRLWVANEDAQFSASPYSLTVTDVADLCGETAGAWPSIPFRPLPLLTRLGNDDSADGESMGYYVEISLDGGTTYSPCTGDCHPLADRLGVRFDIDNLAKIGPAASEATDSDNMFAELDATASNVKVRLRCTIAGPIRAISEPAIRDSAGTDFETGSWHDRGALGQARTNVNPSGISSDYAALPDDSTTEDGDLSAVADAIQAEHEGRWIEAGLAIEWPDEPLELGQIIEQIAGIDYPLATGGGSTPRYPRIVGLAFNLTPETWSVQLALDTYRKAGVA
jgi:hypothetical protein